MQLLKMLQYFALYFIPLTGKFLHFNVILEYLGCHVALWVYFFNKCSGKNSQA